MLCPFQAAQVRVPVLYLHVSSRRLVRLFPIRPTATFAIQLLGKTVQISSGAGSGLVSTHVFKMLGNPTNLVSCITSNPTVQTFNNAVPIPSGSFGLVSTRVFQTVSKVVPNPANGFSCIPSTFVIQLRGKAVPNPANQVSCITSNPITQTLSSGLSNPSKQVTCVVSRPIIHITLSHDSGLVYRYIIQALTSVLPGVMPVVHTLSNGIPNPSNQNTGLVSVPVVHTVSNGIPNPSTNNQNTGYVMSPPSYRR
jgi:hypothetical protein